MPVARAAERVARIAGSGFLFSVFGLGAIVLAAALLPAARLRARAGEAADLVAQRWISRAFALFIQRYVPNDDGAAMIDACVERLRAGRSRASSSRRPAGIPVADAKASRHATALLDIPFYMAGESHPPVAQKIGSWPTNQRTNAFGKAKTDACQRVFISAIKSLQQRAQIEGGDAVIDVRSNTKNQKFESSTEFQCAAGAVVANVALTGTIVKLAGK